MPGKSLKRFLDIAFNSAKPDTDKIVNLQIAYRIWEKLGLLDDTPKKEDMSEREISSKTWEGCTPESYDQNKKFWQQKNDEVMAYINMIRPKKTISRSVLIDDTEYIALYDRKGIHIYAPNKRKRLYKMRPLSPLEKQKKEQELGPILFKGIKELLPNIPEETQKNLEKELTRIYTQGFLDGRKTAVEGLLETLKG